MSFLFAQIYLWLGGVVGFWSAIILAKLYPFNWHRFKIIFYLVSGVVLGSFFFKFSMGTLLIIAVCFGVLVGLLSYSVISNKIKFECQIASLTFILLLSLIILAGLFIRLYNFNTNGIIVDEHFHLKTAAGYLRTGKFIQWDFVQKTGGSKYTRTWIYTWQVAQVFKWLDINLKTGRLVSLFWGILLFAPFLMLTKILKLSRLQTLIGTFWLALSPYLITSSRWLRMYSMFTVVFLAFIVAGFKFQNEQNLIRKISYLFFSLGLASLNFMLHKIIFLLFIFAALIFLTVDILFFGKTKYFHKSWGLLLALTLLPPIAFSPIYSKIFFKVLSSISKEAGTFKLINLYYLIFPFSHWYKPVFGGIILSLPAFFCSKKPREKFLIYTSLITLLIQTFSSRKIPQVRYIGHLLPILIPMTILGLYRLILKINDKGKKLFLAILILVTLIVPAWRATVYLPRIWRGDIGFISFPGRKSKSFKKTLSIIQSHVKSKDNLLIYDLPDYYVAQINKNYKFIRGLGNKLSIEEIKIVENSGKQSWIVVANWYRPPLSETVKSYLDEHYKKLNVKLHDINIYERKLNDKNDCLLL